MRYPYHDAADSQFEALVVEVCVALLGQGVHGFSTGPDEGRDARFEGTAERFPSEREPYSGRFVIQAKHTEHPYAKFSDSMFSAKTETSVLAREVPRIRRLVDEGELDHYLLFANRRLGGQAERSIRTWLLHETEAKTVELFGVERLDGTVKRFPATLDLAGMSELRAPLRITPDDLAEVIVALNVHKRTFREARKDIEFRRTAFDRKNELNNMGDNFAKEIVRTYLRDFSSVRDFLSHPDNQEIYNRYLEAVAEFNEQIIAHRKNDQPFETVLVHLQRLLWARDSDLARNKRLTKLVLYYMYWVCDLGEDE